MTFNVSEFMQVGDRVKITRLADGESVVGTITEIDGKEWAIHPDWCKEKGQPDVFWHTHIRQNIWVCVDTLGDPVTLKIL